MKYRIEEAFPFKARREGCSKEFNSLKSAKSYASKNQKFYGTVLHIYDTDDNLIAHKTPYCGGQQGQWHNH